MASPNLGIVPVAPNQSSKETTINNADLAVEYATQRPLAVDLSAGNVTLTNTDYTRYFVFFCSGQTASRNLIVPLELTVGNACNRIFAVVNLDATYPVVVKGATGATVTLAPLEGTLLSSDGVDITALYKFPTGSQPIDLGGYWRDVLTNNCVILAFKFARAVTVPVNALASVASCGVNPTATATLLVKKNGSNIGTLAFSTGGVPTFTIAGGASFAIGDELKVVGQASADATLAEVLVTIVGYK